MARHVLSRRVVPLLLMTVMIDLGAMPVFAQKDISTELARAESLYYNADFKSALDLLLDLEQRVGNNPQSAKEQLNVEVYLGLAYLALNNSTLAKSRFVEVCSLDSNYRLDPQSFPPKATTLFEEARTQCAENYCAEICGQRQASALNISTAFDPRSKPATNQCSCTPPGPPSPGAIAKSRFQHAEELYRKGQFSEASQEFSAALALDNSNQLATQYLKLTEMQLELKTKATFSDWRRYFDNHEFEKAADAYRNIRSANVEPLGVQLTGQVESEYGRTFGGLVKSWHAACEAGNATKMAAIREQAAAVDAGLQLGRDALVQMQQCMPTSCIQGDPVLALRRLKTRNNIEIDPNLQRYISRGVRIDLQIDGNGNPKVRHISNANSRLADALKNAIEQWEFYPALVDSQPRCVETELPITLIQH